LNAVVLLNAAAGSLASGPGGPAAERISAAFTHRGVDAVVKAVARERLAPAIREAVGSRAEAVVVGGGDGTLNAAAAALVGSGKPLGILPLGTLNHFARDLGIPLDLEAAVGTIAAGQVRDVDVGEVNGRIFLNNSSIGLYPAAVAGREELRHHGHGKWMAMLYASFAVLRRYPVMTLVLRAEGDAARLTTPCVFVGNNEYAVRLLALGRRAFLDRGTLAVYVTRNTGRLGLLRLALRALLGRLEQDRDFHSLRLPELRIESRRRALTVAVDGELMRCAPPINYRIRARELRVLAPPPADPAGAVA
jgi:diacylglycerol kinase family enzyme